MELAIGRLLLFLVALRATAALFEDQAGDFDWYQQYVGSISWMAFDKSPQGTKRLLVGSEHGVLAAINTRTGDIVWRQIFEEGSSIDAILHSKLALLTVSHSGGRLRSWETSAGTLKWEVAMDTAGEETRSYPLDTQWRPGAVLATLAGKSDGSVVVVTKTRVSSLVARTGEMQWNSDLDESSVPCAVHSSGSVVSVMAVVEGVQLVVTQFDAASGEVVKKQELPAPWLHSDSSSCVVTGTSIACLEQTKLDLYTAKLENSDRFSLTMLPSLGITEDSWLHPELSAGRGDDLVLRVSHTVFLLALKDSVTVAANLSYVIPVDVWVEKGSSVDMVLVYGEGGMSVQCWREGGEKLEEMSRAMEVTENRGRPLKAVAYVIEKANGSQTFRLALRMQDHTLLMLHPGQVAWQREEALATVAKVEMLDLPAGQTESTEQFVAIAQSEGNPLTLAVQRLRLQLLLVKEFLDDVGKRGVSSILVRDDPTHLIRDQFNTRKVIVMATKDSKLYGLDSKTGAIIWQQFLTTASGYYGSSAPLALHILRSTGHPPHPPLAVLLTPSQLPTCTGSLLHAFNPLTGEPVTSDPVCLPVIHQTLLLPVLDHTHCKTLLLLSSDLTVHTFPSTPHTSALFSTLTEQLHFFVAMATTGDITGYQVDYSDSETSLSTSQIWRLHFPVDSERILSVVTKSSNELVSSLGRVKSDRSVQYKYLNPHLVAVVTESTDSLKPFVVVYLVDGVTGAVVHHTTHKQAAGPVRLVLSENWLVYHYHNSKLRRYELTVLELHETSSNQTHTVWSSLIPPPPPEVTGQAYAFLSPLSTLSTTHTLRGITLKNILLGLHSGHIASIPKLFLDPRRKVEVTDEMKAEGLSPYIPHLNITPILYINYNRTVARLDSVVACSSGLESTSLVLAYGLDLFFTRVQPSKQFDLLAEDFDYLLVAGVVLGLVVGTLVLSKLSSRKTLKLLWK